MFVMTTAISVKNLHKSYGKTEVVKGINFQVEKGEIYALLGPNGAGKTTTVEILEGHRKASSGDIKVLNFNPQDNNRNFTQQIGIVLQQTGIEPYLTVEETINLFRGYFNNPRTTDEIVEITGLKELRAKRVRKLSVGQQRRLDVAVGLTGDPELLFLDEPTTGFDPIARRGAWEMVQNLQSIGKTIFLTTHYMEEAEILANRVGIIVEGQIIAEGSPKELSQINRQTIIKFNLPKTEHLFPETISNYSADDTGQFTIKTSLPEELLFQLTQWSIKEKIPLEGLNVSIPSLEDAYLDIVQKPLDENN
jgi:ABC-2 type transport system ATP-binding protein